MLPCPYCGAPTRDTARLCATCGQDVLEQRLTRLHAHAGAGPTQGQWAEPSGEFWTAPPGWAPTTPPPRHERAPQPTRATYRLSWDSAKPGPRTRPPQQEPSPDLELDEQPTWPLDALRVRAALSRALVANLAGPIPPTLDEVTTPTPEEPAIDHETAPTRAGPMPEARRRKRGRPKRMREVTPEQRTTWLKDLIQARNDVENRGEYPTFEAVCGALYPEWGLTENPIRDRLKDAKIPTKPALWDNELSSVYSPE